MVLNEQARASRRAALPAVGIVAGRGAQRPWHKLAAAQGRVGPQLGSRRVQALQQQGIIECATSIGQRQDVGQLLQVADLCVMSSHQENFPLVMVEALQAGCLVVATEVSGLKEWLSPALLTPANDVEGLHRLLCATLARLSSLHANYLPIFLRAQQELTIEGMTQRTEDFYHDLLEST